MGFFDWFSRGGRVVRGKANAAMDAIEDANFETTIKQTIKDMKGELRQLVNASADAIANATRLERQHKKIEMQANEWKGKAKTALKAGNEDLARRALVKSKQFSSDAANLEPSVGSAAKVASNLEGRISQLKDRIAEAERNAATLVARRNAASAQKKVAMALADVGNADDAFATLARFENQIEKEEAAAVAFDKLAAGNDDGDLAAQIAALETSSLNTEMDDDLAALKAELDM